MRIILIICLLMTSVSGFSQQASSAIERYTVKEVKAHAFKLDKKDALVEIKGFLHEQKENEEDTFWFSDATGRLLVEFDDDDLPLLIPGKNIAITIIGEVDYDLLEGVEVEVEKWTLQEPEKSDKTQ